MNGNKTKFAIAYVKSVGRPICEIADECGISPSTAYRWMQDEDFRSFLKERTEAYWSALEYKATKSLAELVDMGDSKAVIYVLDKLRYKDDNKVTIGDIEINITQRGNEDED